MANPDPQLVESIVQAVLAGLRAGTPSPAATPAPGATPTVTPVVEIHPPAGVCTGDYSKFIELKGQAITPPPAPASGPAASPASAGPTSTVPTPPTASPTPLTGIVTAAQLQAAMDTGPDRVALLAPEARLSPLAADLARQLPARVRRLALGDPALARPAAPGSPFLWWIEGHCPVVRELTQTHRERLSRFGVGLGGESLASVVRELAAAVRRKRAPGGVLFVEHAPKALCMVNRCRSLRGAHVARLPALEHALRDLAPNTLVLEYPYTDPQELARLVARFIGQSPAPWPVLERALEELHRAE
jgi:hypothetical protein